jgi:hypothetical protein
MAKKSWRNLTPQEINLPTSPAVKMVPHLLIVFNLVFLESIIAVCIRLNF